MVFWRKKEDKAKAAETVTDSVNVPESDPAAVTRDAAVENAPAGAGVIAVAAPYEAASVPAVEDEADSRNWLARMTQGLSQSSARLTQGLGDILTKRKLDQDMLDQLEDALIMADLGPRTAARIIETFGRDRFGKDMDEHDIRQALADSVAAILRPVAQPLVVRKPESGGPFTILVCGVNGVGKTTTIGKIAQSLRQDQNYKIMLAAGDTFRAAAVEQLEIWARRTGSLFLKKDVGADSAAVAFEAYGEAKAQGADVLLIDTAGRLHNKSDLMAELQKIVRVLRKQDEALPHAVLLVLDATTGQNAHEQVRVFKEMLNVTGLVVTKLDGTAKGGVVVSLADQFALPIHMIGVGETARDLRPFDPDDFARALVGGAA